MTAVEVNERLTIREQILDCDGCELQANCTSPVPFYGPSPAPSPIAVLGEAPGEEEDREGRPFIGPAGQLARKHLTEVGLNPDDLAWFNTVSCWPRGTPTAEHVKACAGNREAQLALLAPDFLLVFGKTALQALRPDLEIKRGRGRPFLYESTVVWAAYHPAAILRNRVWEVAFREDLEGFVAMVKGGRDEWWRFISDRCVVCPDYVERFDPTGIGWCARHHPEDSGPRQPELVPATRRQRPVEDVVASQKMF